ncbi:3-phosphoshikimate 1-carboxyvinyltransferase [Helicobacter sp. 16-1353]|uniref:3-phosphoshikimate 1-carboxyvinyltransferase n=1 Tax=Helicobacter sp. 16-1353 TaxID=2004996 RepID=UPI000DCD5BA7|nr:3-phosphoshikimate 1-carboxyvinyltransferase [Helicobacter sp. 16-1353]RAX51798.1 3-phosphoshikimate 1-carboxyvinyltransferase [Helicobacter sp. 16-1353]
MRNTLITPFGDFVDSGRIGDSADSASLKDSVDSAESRRFKDSADSSDFIIIDSIASDKSISHRSVIFSLLSDKKTRIKNYLFGEDTLDTLKIALKLGLKLESNKGNLSDLIALAKNNYDELKGVELILEPEKSGIQEPNDILYCGNAGTAIRLYMGLLARSKGQFILSGDKYLNSRPMGRIINPLKSIGANISARCNDTLAPICVRGANLKPFKYHSEISSAQVKSAMILAALGLEGESHFSEVSKSRDHSEKMLLGMGANLKIENNNITIIPDSKPLNPLDIAIPSDPSSAFYFAVLGAIIPNAKICLKNILLNETRIEAFYVLQKMGANIDIKKTNSTYEDIGDICVSGGNLMGIEVDSNIAWLIDEIPALGVAFAFAKGKSKVINAKELRIKESDRIKATIEGLKSFGVKCEELEDGFIIEGGVNAPKKYIQKKHIQINSYGDHRIAMSFAIMGVLYSVEILDSACIDVSFPNFLNILSRFAKIENAIN